MLRQEYSIKISADIFCGTDGYPDTTYFVDVDRRLNQLNVPPTEHLDGPYYQYYVHALQEEALQQGEQLKFNQKS